MYIMGNVKPLIRNILSTTSDKHRNINELNNFCCVLLSNGINIFFTICLNILHCMHI